jgi:hypothetical protein
MATAWQTFAAIAAGARRDRLRDKVASVIELRYQLSYKLSWIIA